MPAITSSSSAASVTVSRDRAASSWSGWWECAGPADEAVGRADANKVVGRGGERIDAGVAAGAQHREICGDRTRRLPPLEPPVFDHFVMGYAPDTPVGSKSTIHPRAKLLQFSFAGISAPALRILAT